jgi:mono/diheme cytochrome c family protein
MKGLFRLVVFLLGIAAVLVFIAAAVVLRGGVSARAEPSRLEAKIARAFRHWAIPAAARARRNLAPATAEALADARAHFADHCAICHDNDGSGSGRIGRGLYPRAPDLRAAATQDLSDGEIFWIIENGVRLTGMPAWGAPGSEEDSWKLVHFIRRLPELTPEEKLEMEELNPRGPAEWREHEEEQRFLRGEDEPQPNGEERRRADGDHATHR